MKYNFKIVKNHFIPSITQSFTQNLLRTAMDMKRLMNTDSTLKSYL